MPWKNSDNRYSTVSIALHWLMLVLLIAVYACIELRGIFPKGSGGRTLIKEAHFMLGQTVFVLVWLRLLARSTCRCWWLKTNSSPSRSKAGTCCWVPSATG